jgi:FlaA1/EpsC-like NDP-sugar epimerase
MTISHSNLTEKIVKKLNPKVIYTKPAAGEKLFEELVTETEINRTIIFKANYVIIPELNENITSSKFLKKVFSKYKKYKKISKILRSDNNISSLDTLKKILNNSKLT